MELIADETLRGAFDTAGLPFPDREPEPGELLRFSTNGRAGDAAGWLRIFPDAEGAAFGCWRSGASFTWQRRREGPLPTAEESARWRAKAEASRHQAELEREAGYVDAALLAADEWNKGRAPGPEHAYLCAKRIPGEGLRQDANGRLLAPVRNEAGDLQSIQYIGADGTKRFLPGGRVAGGRCWLGEPGAVGPLVLCEGFATAASIRQTTGWPTCACFSAGNLRRVAESLRRQFKGAEIFIAADDDWRTEGNPGLTKAIEAAEAIKGKLIVPDFGADRPESASDFNDLSRLRGDGTVRRAFLADAWPGDGLDIAGCMATPAPPQDWFIKERIPAGRAGLLAAVGGSSKTRMQFHLAVGACIGRLPWSWQVARTGRAALVLAEDTAADAHHALRLIASALTSDERRLVAERLIVWTLAGEDARLLRLATNGGLIPTERAVHLLRRLKMTRDLVFIGLDPALALTDGDELNPAHQRRLGEFCDRLAIDTGACVLLSAHAAKGSQSLDEPGSHTARGSGALTDCVRFEFVLRTMTAQEGRQFGISDIAERKAHVQLVATKGNALPPSAFAPMWLRRGIGGALEPAELERQEVGAVGRRERAALTLLRDLCRESTPALKEWRHACDEAGILSGKAPRAKESCMERTRDALLGAGLIVAGIGRGVFTPVEDAE
jgi:putative DNA primase/helicase